MAVGADRRVEISVNSSDPDPSSPDERVFVLHEVDDNILFIQPYHHKGKYHYNHTMVKLGTLRQPYSIREINLRGTFRSSAVSCDRYMYKVVLNTKCEFVFSHQ